MLCSIYLSSVHTQWMFDDNTVTEWCVYGGGVAVHCSSELRIATISNSEKEAPLLQKYTSKLLLYNRGNCSLDKSQRKVTILSINGVVITVEGGNYCF